MIIDNIKNFFKKKSNSQDALSAPEGVCPNCWGRQEWEGQYYKKMKALNITPESDTYNNFIKEFVTKHLDGIVLSKDTYTCITCEMTFDKE